MASGLILTAVGAEEIETAYQAGKVVLIPTVSFGDGGGYPVTVDPARTSLVGKFGECPFSQGANIEGLIGGSAVINCREFPGKTLREFGLMSTKGTLIAYGAYPETYLPEQNDSIVKEVIIEFIMPLVHAEVVTIVIDPNVAVITQTSGDKRYLQKSKNLSDVASIKTARENLSVYSKVESDELFESKGTSYTKTESNNKYQLKGEYALVGVSYTKSESDGKYQLKGSYALTGDSYTKNESDIKYYYEQNPPPVDTGQTTVIGNGAYFRYSSGQIFMQTISNIVCDSTVNPEMLITLPASFSAAILSVTGSFSGNGGDNQDSWWSVQPVGRNQLNLHTRNMTGTFSFTVTGY